MFTATLLAIAAAAFVRAQSDVSSAAEAETMTLCSGFAGLSMSKCWAVYTTGGGVASVPIAQTTVAPSAVTRCVGDGCYVVVSSEGSVYTSPITVTSAAATAAYTGTETYCSGDMCYEIYSTGGGIAKVPITRTTLYVGATSADSVVTATAVGAVSQSGTNKSISVILPAVLGSIGGLIFLIVGTILFLRYRSRKAVPSREWVNNPKLGFVEGPQAAGAREMSQADVDGLRGHAAV